MNRFSKGGGDKKQEQKKQEVEETFQNADINSKD